MEESRPGKEGHPPSRVNYSERLYENKSWPLCPSQELTTVLAREFIRLSELKCFIWRRVGTARRMALPSTKDEPARRCFSCKQLVKFCREMYQKLARPAG